VRALEAAQKLPAGGELVVLTERRPTHLLPILHERGLTVSSRELPDGHETHIRR
jgi:hypothetical protein